MDIGLVKLDCEGSLNSFPAPYSDKTFDQVAKRLPGALLPTELVLDLIGGAAVGWGLET